MIFLAIRVHDIIPSFTFREERCTNHLQIIPGTAISIIPKESIRCLTRLLKLVICFDT